MGDFTYITPCTPDTLVCGHQPWGDYKGPGESLCPFGPGLVSRINPTITLEGLGWITLIDGTAI